MLKTFGRLSGCRDSYMHGVEIGGRWSYRHYWMHDWMIRLLVANFKHGSLIGCMDKWIHEAMDGAQLYL